MPYDASLDVEVFSRAVENEAGRLSVKVMSYNEGAKKLQISRERRGAEGDF
jgi:ribosomal protein L31E